MFCSRCLLPALALYLYLEELSAFLLPDRLRLKRGTAWLEQEFAPNLSELSDLAELFPGDAGETTQDWGSRHPEPSAFFAPLERLSVQLHNSHRQKPSKRRRVTAPLDPIGGSLLSGHRSRKDEAEHQEYSE